MLSRPSACNTDSRLWAWKAGWPSSSLQSSLSTPYQACNRPYCQQLPRLFWPCSGRFSRADLLARRAGCAEAGLQRATCPPSSQDPQPAIQAAGCGHGEHDGHVAGHSPVSAFPVRHATGCTASSSRGYSGLFEGDTQEETCLLCLQVMLKLIVSALSAPSRQQCMPL